MKDSSLTIGITSYNRADLLRGAARSLAQVHNLRCARVLVLDDCSTEFDVDHLKALFPTATVIRHDANSGGADQAMHRLFQKFVRDGAGYLLNLDADLIASRNLVDRCLQIIASDRLRATPCLYSVFNAPTHPAIGLDGEFLVKKTIGAAGTLWEHGLLADVLSNVPVSRKFDWDWSAYLATRGVPIRVTPQSHVQHLGRVGQHSRSLVGMDHGKGFDDYRGENLADFLDCTRDGILQMLAEQQQRIDRQNQAIVQLTEVIQSQGQVVSEIIRHVAPDQLPAGQADRAAPRSTAIGPTGL